MDYKLSSKFSGVKIISSEMEDGAMNYRRDQGANMEKFARLASLSLPILSCEQTHGTKVIFTDRTEHFAEADGVLTKSDFAVSVRSADCLPLMIFEKRSGLIGGIHVSRRNLEDGIIENLSRLLREQNAETAKTVVFFGPHIRQKNYKIRAEGDKLFSPTLERFIDQQNRFDFTGATIYALEKEGFLSENIEDCGIDTFSDERFFSFRRMNCPKNVEVFATIISKKND